MAPLAALYGRRSGSDDGIHAALHQIRCESWQARQLSVCKPITSSVSERWPDGSLKPSWIAVIRAFTAAACPGCSIPSLRACTVGCEFAALGERNHRATEQRDEVAPSDVEHEGSLRRRRQS